MPARTSPHAPGRSPTWSKDRLAGNPPTSSSEMFQPIEHPGQTASHNAIVTNVDAVGHFVPRPELMPHQCSPTEIGGEAIRVDDSVGKVCRCTVQWPSQIIRGIAEMDVAEVDHPRKTTSVDQHMLRSEVAVDDGIRREFPRGIQDLECRIPLSHWNQRHDLSPETADYRNPAAPGFRRRR